MQSKLDNVNIVSSRLLPTPLEVREKLPLSDRAIQTVSLGRESIERILSKDDKRRFLVVGPCAIHDVKAGIEYAKRLKDLADAVSDTFLLVMRVYFEKPRTTTGWKGLINDPHLDDSFSIEEGLFIARKLLLDIAEVGLPIGTEALDPLVPQYLSDLVSWTAIGARTAESQTHREMSSGLSTPVGFKNSTDGNVLVAINAVKAASIPHRFLGISDTGQSSVFHTKGNRFGHVVLRGGNTPNYSQEHITLCSDKMVEMGITPNIVIDCSHGNSLKDPGRQPEVFRSCISQISNETSAIVGLMLESNLFWGRQEIEEVGISGLRYGVSITDACIDWEMTEKLIKEARESLQSC